MMGLNESAKSAVHHPDWLMREQAEVKEKAAIDRLRTKDTNSFRRSRSG